MMQGGLIKINKKTLQDFFLFVKKSLVRCSDQRLEKLLAYACVPKDIFITSVLQERGSQTQNVVLVPVFCMKRPIICLEAPSTKLIFDKICVSPSLLFAAYLIPRVFPYFPSRLLIGPALLEAAMENVEHRAGSNK